MNKFRLFTVILIALSLACGKAADIPLTKARALPKARVVIVEDAGATQAFMAVPEKIPSMVERGLLSLTGRKTAGAAWRSLVSTNEVIGIKVYSAPGKQSGTRPAVVGAVVESLLASGITSSNIVIWDKQLTDLRLAGFDALAEKYKIRIAGAAQSGFDEKVFYENSILGKLIWGDLEFQSKAESAGRKSHVSKLVTQKIKKIINISPMLNHNEASVAGSLYSLALGSVDNSIRFENSPERLATAVPEIYGMPELADRVVLNIVDGLICQYEGEERSLVHYSSQLNQLRFSKDPVAIDVLSVFELDRQRQASGNPPAQPTLELLKNASLLELGVSDTNRIVTEIAK